LTQVHNICAEAGIEPDERGPELTKAGRQAMGTGGPAGDYLRQKNAEVTAVNLQAQLAEGEARVLRAEREKERLGAGGGDQGSFGLLLQQMQMQNQLFQQQVSAQIQALTQQIQQAQAGQERPTATPAADFARTFKEVLSLQKELTPAPPLKQTSPEDAREIARINQEDVWHRQQMALDERRLQLEEERAMREYELRRERNDFFAEQVKAGIASLSQIGAPMFQAWMASKNGAHPNGAAPAGFQCASCHSALEIDPGAGPTQWRCPAPGCGAVNLHTPGRPALELVQAAPPPLGLPNGGAGDGLLSGGQETMDAQVARIYNEALRRQRPTTSTPRYAVRPPAAANGQPPGPPSGGYVVGNASGGPVGPAEGGAYEIKDWREDEQPPSG
jgi:hypothetical protein